MAKRNLQNVFFDKLSFYLIASGIFGLVTLTPSTFSPGAISEFWQNTDKAVEIENLSDLFEELLSDFHQSDQRARCRPPEVQ